MPLTDAKIRSTRPESKPVRLFDGGRMFLLIETTGAKMWRLKYRFHGKEKSLSLGVYPGVSLAEARKQREKARALLKQNIDPSVARREERARKAAERHQEEAKRKAPRLSVALDGKVEIWKAK